MKTFVTSLVACMAALVALAAPIQTAQAEVKPAVVVSVGSMTELLGDVAYLAETAGNANAGKSAALMAGIFLNGVDRDRPTGAYMTFDGMNPQVVAFVPVKDLDVLLLTHKENIGEPKDIGDGVLELSAPTGQPVYIKEVSGWAYVTNEQKMLSDLPKDPVGLLAGLNKEYSIAVRVNVQNIPSELRKMAIAEMTSAMERSLDQQAGDLDDEAREAQEKIVRSSIKSFSRLFEEAETFTIGWEVDSMKKATWIDSSMVAVKGTKLARQAALLKSTTSNFAGFLMDDAAMSMNLSTPIDKSEIGSTVAMLETYRAKALEQMEQDGNLQGEKKALAKEVVGNMFDIIGETMKDGKMDGGAVLLLNDEKVQFAAGGHVADGAKLETTLKKLVSIGKDEADFPEFKFNVGTHGGIALHTASAPIEDAEPQVKRVLGDNLEVVIGTGKKVFLVAFGKDSMDLMKKVIDANAADGQKEVKPMQMTISLKPILDFAATVDDSPVTARLIEILDGRDAKVRLTATAIDRGSRSRLEVDQTIIEMIGRAAEEFGAGAPGRIPADEF